MNGRFQLEMLLHVNNVTANAVSGYETESRRDMKNCMERCRWQ